MKIYVTFLGLWPAIGGVAPMFGVAILMPDGRMPFMVVRRFLPSGVGRLHSAE